MRRSMTSWTSSSSRGIAAIVGVGPNLGRSVARKFARQGYTVAILSRDLGRLSRFAEEIAREEKAQVFAIRIDCSDPRSVREAFEGVLSLGFLEVLVYNAYQPVASTPTRFLDIGIESFEKSIAVSSVGAFHCAQQVIPGMLERGRGTILFTGCSGSLSGTVGFSELCCGKFALRPLAQCLAREFQGQGIHVAHVIIDGIIGSARSTSQHDCTAAIYSGWDHGIFLSKVYFVSTSRVGPSTSQPRQLGSEPQKQPSVGVNGEMDPDTIAQTFWYLHTQDRSAWTNEIDLRSSTPS